MKNKKIIIAGGTGFIGQGLAERWAKDNQVIILRPQGNGRQMYSWVPIDDVSRAIEWFLDHPALEGTYNLSAPEPVTNRFFLSTMRQIADNKSINTLKTILMSVLQDQRLKAVRWRDLMRLSFREKLIENTITFPWLIASLTLAHFRLYLFAVPCSFLYFLTGLRQVHNGFHYTLGISRAATWLTLFLNSMLMMTAMHAVHYNHLRHHRYCLQEEDVEGSWARMKPLQAIVLGAVYIWRQHAFALRHGG